MPWTSRATTREVAVTLWPWLILVVLYGACVGSFLNVVIYRMPAGESLLRPGSHCPRCQRGLAWFENIPIVSWLVLRARCRTCGASISAQYPLVEAVCALLFGMTFYAYYLSPWRPEFAGAEALASTWPVLLVHLVLVAALLAASVVDMKLFIIPLDIPNCVTLVALVGLPLAAWVVPGSERASPAVGAHTAVAAFGGLGGLGVAYLLLRRGLVPQSFAPDPDEPAPDVGEDASPHGSPEQWLAYPHPRREVAKELLYIAWPAAGVVTGFFAARIFLAAPSEAPWPPVSVMGGVIWGYLAGASLIWGIRILGTLAFGKEAMGLGDVHVLAAIGAVFGAGDALIVFFIAPFAGLAGSVVVAGVGRLLKGEVRAIPYGPYLAAAALIWTWFQMPLREAYATLFLPIP